MRILLAVVVAVMVVGCRPAVRRSNVKVALTPEGLRCMADAEASFTRCREVGRKSQCMKLRNDLVDACPKPKPGEEPIEEQLPQLPGWHP